MNIKQTAAVSSILMAIVLVGGGCIRSYAPVAPEPAATPATVTNEAKPEIAEQPKRDIPALRNGSGTTVPPDPVVTNSATLASLKDAVDSEIKIAFSFPAALGTLTTTNEYGVGMETNIETATSFDCLAQRAFNLNGKAILVVNDTWQCQTFGRMGYWGDQARLFSTEADVKKWCEAKDVCTPYVNPNGITIYHAYTKSVDFFGDTLSDIDEYGAWNPNKDIHGILISNQGFVQAGQGRMQDEVIVVADSLSFLE